MAERLPLELVTPQLRRVYTHHGSVEVAGLTCYEKYVLWKGKNLQQVWDSFVQEDRLDIGIERAGAIFYAFEIKEKYYPNPGGPG